ncbi:hypothetical protein BHM03_00059790 [Ensete ventricosum]|nr:hypothetical protein BHM03_00059790 [Ensete ventricosum]
MSFYAPVFVGYYGPLPEMVKGIVFKASFALVGPYDFTQTWVIGAPDLFLKCHLQLNQLQLLMQHSQISGYFHDLSEERTTLPKVFSIDDLRSTTNDCKKIELLQR